ncbi:MAG: DVUA0089 family protein [Planctomycetaceae bacterium]
MSNGLSIRSLMFWGALSLTAGAANSAFAVPVTEVEPNNTLATAQNIDFKFSYDADSNITDSTLIPHATISGTGDGTFDYYSFTVYEPGFRGIFDIDFTFPFGMFGTFDPMLFLYAADGTLLAQNDNIPLADPVDAGSMTRSDPYIDYTFASAGTYIIGVAETGSIGAPGGIIGDAPDVGDFYILNASVTGVPEPTTIALFGAGCASLIAYRRRKRRAEDQMETTAA